MLPQKRIIRINLETNESGLDMDLVVSDLIKIISELLQKTMEEKKIDITFQKLW
jgi:hypothetical protein